MYERCDVSRTAEGRPGLQPAPSPCPHLFLAGRSSYAEWDEPDTIAAVQAALATAHEVVLIENNSTVEAGLRASAPDIVFNMAEGLAGPDREARIPALLERWGIPFTGSSARTLRTCLDKAATKRVLQQHGLPTPAYAVLSCADRLPDLPAFPLIVKPLHEGSSKGIEQSLGGPYTSSIAGPCRLRAGHVSPAGPGGNVCPGAGVYRGASG